MNYLSGMMDMHIHLSRRSDDLLIPFAVKNGLKYNKEELFQLMDQYGISKGLLLSPPLSGGGSVPNADMIELCNESGGRLSPVITVDPGESNVVEAINLAIENKDRIKGFKIRLGYINAYATDMAFSGLYDFAEREGLPILFHTGDTATGDGSLDRSHPRTLDALANARSGLNMVLCHFGNPWFMDVAELIYKHPNVYADISGLVTGEGKYRRKYMAWLAKRISEAIFYAGGAEKVLFGTDYPVCSFSDAIELLEQLDIDDSDKGLVARENSARLFRL